MAELSINADQIAEALRKHVGGFTTTLEKARVGRVLEVGDGIARVHGVATAAGCQLVASCDLAIAADNARFATPGVNIGLFCSTPMVALSRAVGRKAAMEMLLTGELIDAVRARELGLVNRVVPEAELACDVHRAARACNFDHMGVARGLGNRFRIHETDVLGHRSAPCGFA